MVCSDPPEDRARWTVRLVAQEAIKQRLVPRVGREAIRILLDHDLKSWREKMWWVRRHNRCCDLRMHVLVPDEKPRAHFNRTVIGLLAVIHCSMLFTTHAKPDEDILGKFLKEELARVGEKSKALAFGARRRDYEGIGFEGGRKRVGNLVRFRKTHAIPNILFTFRLGTFCGNWGVFGGLGGRERPAKSLISDVLRFWEAGIRHAFRVCRAFLDVQSCRCDLSSDDLDDTQMIHRQMISGRRKTPANHEDPESP
jgi:hypothetical protein